MKRIIDHIVNKGPVITNALTISSETMIDKDEYNIIENDIGHCDNSFQLG